MSEETKTPVEGAAETKQIELELTPVTEEDIVSARRSGDSARLSELADRLSKQKEKKAFETKDSAEDVAKKEADEKAKREFKVYFKNREVIENDEDTYLGQGSHGKLKRQFILNRESLKDAEEEIQRALQFGNSTKAEYDALKEKYEEAVAKLKVVPAASPVPAQQSSAPKTEAAAAPTKIEIPEPPKFDEKDRSLWTEEMWDEQAQYESKLREALVSSINRPTTATSSEETRALREELNTIKAEREAEKARIDDDKKRRDAEAAEGAMWGEFSTMQNRFKDFSTKKPVKELHEAVLKWMDKVAGANGVTMPYGANAQQVEQYNMLRGGIVGKYLVKDQDVIKKSEGLDPPEDYKQYFELADIWQKKQSYVKSGKLGPAASLEDAYLIDLRESGKLDQATDGLEQESYRNGANGVLNGIESHQKQYAQNLDNSSSAPSGDIDALPKEDVTKLLTLFGTQQGRDEIERTPDLKAKWEKLKPLVFQ